MASDKPSKVVIVDDHPAIRRAVLDQVAKVKGLTACGEAKDVQSALN